MAVRNNVAFIRRQRGLTVTALARRAGLARQTIYSIERQPGYRPSANVMFALSQALNENIANLFWQEPDKAAV